MWCMERGTFVIEVVERDLFRSSESNPTSSYLFSIAVWFPRFRKRRNKGMTWSLKPSTSQSSPLSDASAVLDKAYDLRVMWNFVEWSEREREKVMSVWWWRFDGSARWSGSSFVLSFLSSFLLFDPSLIPSLNFSFSFPSNMNLEDHFKRHLSKSQKFWLTLHPYVRVLMDEKSSTFLTRTVKHLPLGTLKEPAGWPLFLSPSPLNRPSGYSSLGSSLFSSLLIPMIKLVSDATPAGGQDRTDWIPSKASSFDSLHLPLSLRRKRRRCSPLIFLSFSRWLLLVQLLDALEDDLGSRFLPSLSLSSLLCDRLKSWKSISILKSEIHSPS